MDEEEEEDMVVMEEYHLSNLTVVKLAMYHDFLPNFMPSVDTAIV
jgi:hypothetical protein